MTLLKPAEVTSARLKMGLLGFQGSGKTKTAALTAIGLIQHCKSLKLPYADKPAAFLDTETGSDWVIPDFKEAGIPLEVAKTRSFADLLAVMNEAEQGNSVLIVDSVTHFWKELCESYCAKKEKERRLTQGTYRLQFQDWAYLKARWGEFTDRFVNSDLHIFLCGRAGYEYDYSEDDDGKKQLEKTGVKMKAEGEMGYEPSLLVQMEQCQKLEGKVVVETWREAHVIKDRSTLIDGKTFIFYGQDDKGTKYPLQQMVATTFNAFLPHIARLNLAGKQLGVDTTRTSEHTIASEKKDWSSTRRKVVLAELEALLYDAFPGQSAGDKQGRAALCRKHFHDEEMTWVKIEEMLALVDLQMGYDSMFREVKGKPSQYAALFETKDAPKVDDEIPDFDRPAAAGAGAPAQSRKERLLAEVAQLHSQADCVHFGIALGNMPGLPVEEFNEVSKALLARQKAIAKGPGDDGNGGQSDEPTKHDPDGGKPADDEDLPGKMPPPASPNPAEPRPAARGKGKDKQPAPVETERTMADLASA